MAKPLLIVSKDLPTALTEGNSERFRAGRYQEWMWPSPNYCYPFVQQGSYFTAINPSPGTGMITFVVNSWAGTYNSILYFYNTETNQSGKLVVPDYIRLIPTIAPVGMTRLEGIIGLRGPLAVATATNLIPKNVNMNSATVSIAKIFTDSSFVSSSAVSRFVSRFQLRASINVVLEEYVIQFMHDVGGRPGTTKFNGADGLRNVVQVAPVALGPLESCALFISTPGGGSSLVPEMELGWLEV